MLSIAPYSGPDPILFNRLLVSIRLTCHQSVRLSRLISVKVRVTFQWWNYSTRIQVKDWFSFTVSAALLCQCCGLPTLLSLSQPLQRKCRGRFGEKCLYGNNLAYYQCGSCFEALSRFYIGFYSSTQSLPRKNIVMVIIQKKNNKD